MSFNLKISKAAKCRSTFHFDMPHLQSAEFMQNNVVFCRNVVPTDHFKVTPVLEARCAPLSVPSFVNMEYHIRGFYVPYSVIWSRFDDWVNGNLTFQNGSQVSTDIPTIGDVTFTEILISASTTTPNDVLEAIDLHASDLRHKYDFVVDYFDSGTTKYRGYVLNNKGRFLYKLFTSLGYKINFTTSGSNGDRLNALPLLAYFKIFSDYFVPSVRKQLSPSTKLISYIYQFTGQSELEYPDYKSALIDACNEVYHTYYPSSYLTASWQTPVSPLSSPATSISGNTAYNSAFGDIISEGGSLTTSQVIDGSLGAEIRAQSNVNNNSPHASNPWVQRNLQAVASWLLRSRFAGSDKLINILSRFGVKPKTPLEHLSRFCGSFTQPLAVQDINSLAQTDGAELGQYAGKMFSLAQQNRTFEFNCDDYGVIIITSMITPATIDYYQGIDRDLLKTKPLQFFQPEFDSVGFELLSARELASGFTFPGWSHFKGTEAIGFVPRYSSYKVGSATVSGDFAVNTLNEGMDSYHNFRGIFKYGLLGSNHDYNYIVPNTGNKNDINNVSFNSSIDDIKAQTSLLQTSYDKNQFNRIFNVQSDGVDHIYTMYHFNVVASRPMRSIADSLPTFDETDDKVDVSRGVIENFK